METIEIRRLKVILLISSIACLVLLLLSARREHFSGTWREHQVAYRASALAQSTTGTARMAAEQMDVRLRQIFLPQLKRIDRCTTCHIGISDPRMADAEQPIRAHRGELFDHHPPERFGCTVCHDGQSRAIEERAAHGEVAHWDAPLLRGESVYLSCSRCHYEADIFGAEEDLYARGSEPLPLVQSELSASIPGLENASLHAIARGKQLLIRSGCLGCHKYRGRGGTLGPDITYVGDKSVHGFDFAHIQGEHTVERLLFEHLKDPARVSPETLMPNLHFTDELAGDLTTYLLSLRRKNMPAEYTPVPPRHYGELATGEQLYGLFCSACHGRDGKGSTVREADAVRAVDAPVELMVPSINHPDTLAVASDDYMRSILANGRSGTNMIGWARTDEGGLRSEEIDAIVDYMRSWEPPGPDLGAVAASRGDVRAGRSIYSQNCAACHGRNGEGDIGVRLNSPTFLGIASDRFLAETISAGRPNTAMPGWRQFDSQRISDVIAFMRSWHPPRNNGNDVREFIADAGSGDSESAASAAIGEVLYKANCVTCHGSDGEGDLGPSLSTQEFLTIVGDDYLYEAIAHGRPGTGMPAWHHLSSADVASLIMFVRTWQVEPSRELSDDMITGDWDTGGFLYAGTCVGCHGDDAEGGVGPQLNNPLFLASASDAMLHEWVSHGKTGTPMRGFLKGEQGTVDLRERQIDDIVVYLRSLERLSGEERVSVAKRPSGRPELGRLWYGVSCAACHGDYGEGSSGPALANSGFLRVASDGYLMATMALGRDGTEMRPVKKSAQSILSLSSDQLNDLVALLRLWEFEPPQTGVTHRFVVPWDLERGRLLYESNCAGCHGIDGKGEMDEPGRLSAWAPDLNNEGFLSAATDGFLQATIVRGRTGTAMRSFGHGTQGLVDLTSQDVDDIVAYIRRWSPQPGLPITIPAEIKTMDSRVSGEEVQQGTDSPKRPDHGQVRTGEAPHRPVAAALTHGFKGD